MRVFPRYGLLVLGAALVAISTGARGAEDFGPLVGAWVGRWMTEDLRFVASPTRLIVYRQTDDSAEVEFVLREDDGPGLYLTADRRGDALDFTLPEGERVSYRLLPSGRLSADYVVGEERLTALMRPDHDFRFAPEFEQPPIAGGSEPEPPAAPAPASPTLSVPPAPAFVPAPVAAPAPAFVPAPAAAPAAYASPAPARPEPQPGTLWEDVVALGVQAAALEQKPAASAPEPVAPGAAPVAVAAAPAAVAAEPAAPIAEPVIPAPEPVAPFAEPAAPSTESVAYGAAWPEIKADPDPAEPEAKEPPPLAGMLGRWEGRWDAGHRAWLEVESVEDDMATVVYGEGPNGDGPGAAFRHPAAVEGQVLVLQLTEGSRLRFMQTGPGVIDASHEWPGGVSYGVLFRADEEKPVAAASMTRP